MAPDISILVAEDSAQVRELIRTQLQAMGYHVQTADNGHDALRRIEQEPPNALILDINMPRVDGFGVLDALKARGSGLPVLVLTARHAEDDVRRAVTLGAKDYLTKPFSEKQLRARVARLLRTAIAAPAAEPDSAPAPAPTSAQAT